MLLLPALYPWLRPEVAPHLTSRFYLNLPSSSDGEPST